MRNLQRGRILSAQTIELLITTIMRYDFWVVPCCFMIVSVHFSALAIEQSDSSLPKLKNQGKWKQRFTSKTMWNCFDGVLWTENVLILYVAWAKLGGYVRVRFKSRLMRAPVTADPSTERLFFMDGRHITEAFNRNSPGREIKHRDLPTTPFLQPRKGQPDFRNDSPTLADTKT